MDCSNMISKLSSAAKVVEMPAISEFMNSAIAGLETLTCGTTAFDVLKEGDRPYRVNSGNISLRQS